MPKTSAFGAIYPEEFKTLESVFEEACRKSKTTPDSPEAETMALKIMLLFQSGVEDHSQLLEAAIKLADADEGQGGDLRVQVQR